MEIFQENKGRRAFPNRGSNVSRKPKVVPIEHKIKANTNGKFRK